jgi:hypothetical protein
MHAMKQLRGSDRGDSEILIQTDIAFYPSRQQPGGRHSLLQGGTLGLYEHRAV